MSERIEKATCAAIIALAWLFFFIQARHTPTLLDDWYQLTWHRHHPLSLSSIWEYGHYNYFNFNPRIGDVLLMIINGPRWIHLLLTPLVQLAVLPLAFIVAFGRLPKLALRDMGQMLVIQILLWLVMPIPGIVYFYRPFTTNYIWAFVLMLALFAPYRLELARKEPGPARHWLSILMLPLGWLAGMGNEHTGPTAMVVMLAFLYVAWRKNRVRPWMIAGAIGLFVGYPMLFFAPGQKLRYAGIATRNTPLYLLQARGPDGLFEVLLDFVAEAQIGVTLVLVALLLALRNKGKQLAALDRKRVLTLVGLIAAAGAIVVTLFASPTIGERLFFAPAVLFVGALMVLVEWLWSDRSARKWLIATMTIAGVYQGARMVQVLSEGYAQNEARMEMLRKAPPNSVVKVPPYGLWKRSRYWWGDDFQYASLREYTANEVYDLKGIEYDRPLHWVEPTPSDRFVVKRTFDPPLSPEEDAKLQPRYVPTFWEWTLVQLRRSMKLGPIAFVKGHKLVHYTVDMVGSRFNDPKRRPIHVFDWTPDKLTFVDGRMFDSPNGQPHVRVWNPSIPTNVVDVYIEACGKTKRVETKDDIWEHVGPLIPITLECRGTFTTFMCEPDQCWLSGRYWR
jgi:hypothetical protein